jgi:hypothetical protein
MQRLFKVDQRCAMYHGKRQSPFFEKVYSERHGRPGVSGYPAVYNESRSAYTEDS